MIHSQLLLKSALIVSVGCSVIGCGRRIANQQTGPARERKVNEFEQTPASEQDVRKITVEQLGFSDAQAVVPAKQIRLVDSVLPNLDDELAGKNAWQVQVEGVRIRPTGSTIENAAIRDLLVTICPGTGHVMKIQGPATAVIPPGPSVADEQTQMAEVGESLTGFPEKAPKVTFAQALNQAMGNAANARGITAYYARHTVAGAYRDRPVWVIQLRGIPPIPPFGVPPGVPKDSLPDEKFLNHTRTIIDAQTGEMMISDSIPQPN